MTKQNQKETSGMRMPHRRDISARQDLLGRELRQLFEDVTQEEMPDELQRLALQLQSAVEGRPPASEDGAGGGTQRKDRLPPGCDGERSPALTPGNGLRAGAAGGSTAGALGPAGAEGCATPAAPEEPVRD